MGLFDGTPLERPVLCERCGLDVKECTCAPLKESSEIPDVEPRQQRLKIRVEKRKRGKTVTVIAGLLGSQQQRTRVLKQLKDSCGAGGTMSDDRIEIQGEHTDNVRRLLKDLGFRLGK